MVATYWKRNCVTMSLMRYASMSISPLLAGLVIAKMDFYGFSVESAIAENISWTLEYDNR